MRILIIAHDSGIYGASKSLLSLCEYFIEVGYDLHVIVPETGPFEKSLMQMGVSRTVIHFEKWIFPKHPVKESLTIAFKNYIKRRLHAIKCILDYALVMKEFKTIGIAFNPDIIYTNTITHPLGILLAKKLKKPHVWHIREFIEEHGIYFVLGLWLVKYFLSKSTKNVYISYALKEKFALNVDNNSIIVPNGILLKEKITQYQPFAKEREFHKPLRLLSLGRISMGKRHDVAIKTLSELIHAKNIEAELSITGAGDTTSLELLTQKLRLTDKVNFTGHSDNVFEMYETHDILIVGSEMEGFGRVTAEAMATGMIVIGRNTGGTKDIIRNGVNGFLFNDEAEILHIIIMLLQNHQICKMIRINANTTVSENYSLEKYFETMSEVFKNV